VVEQNADVSQLLEALRKVKPFPQSAPTRRTNLQDKIVANRDYAIGAIAQAPTLRDKIDSIKSSGSIPKNGTPKSLLFNNPITKTIFGGLKVIDTPHRMIVSGLREVVDAFDNDPNTRASFDDWIGQVGKDDYGFGTAFPVAGWGGRVLGLVGDVITDPLFWLRPYGAGAGKLATLADGAPLKTALGKTAIAGAPGRNALADYAIRMGRSPEEVAAIGFKGRLGATPEFAKMAGLDKAGLYIAGTKVRLPFTGPIADAFSFGAFGVRSTFVNSKIGGALHRLVTTGDDYIKNLKIGVSTGRLDAPKAQEAIQLLNFETRKRAVSGVARNTFNSGIKSVVEGPEYNEYGKTVYQIMDPKEGFARAPKSAQEKAYAVKIQNILKSAIGDVKTRLNVVDPEAKVGEFIEYWPHMTSEAGINYMAVPSNPYAETTFKFLKEDLFDKDGSFKTRKLKPSSDGKANWFGHALTQDDIDKGIDRLNQLARDGGFVGDFFETDVAAVLSRYGKFYGEQIGKIDYADSLLKSNIGRLRTTHSIIDNEYFDEFANQTAEVSGSVSRATTELIDGINSATKEIERIVGLETKPIGARAGAQEIEKLTRKQKEAAGAIQGILKDLDTLKTNVNQRVEKFESLFDFDDPNDPTKLMKAVFEDYKKSSRTIDKFIENSVKEFSGIDDVALANILFPSQEANILADTLNQGKIISDEKALKVASGYAKPVTDLLLPLKKFQDDLNRINADYELLERRFKLTQMVGNEFAEVVNSILNRSIFETGTLIEKDGKLIANNLPMELEEVAKLLMPSSTEGRILLGFQTDDKMGDFAIKYFETAEGKNLKSIIDPEDLFRKADLRKKGSETVVDFDEFRSVLATSNPSVSDVLTLRRVISNYAMRDIKKYGSAANLPPSLRTKFDATLAKLTQLNEFQDKVEKVVRTANGNPDFIKNFDKLDEALEEIGQKITQTTARITALTETNTYAKFADEFTSLANSRSGSIVPRDLDELRSLSGNITKGKQLYDDFVEGFIKVYDEQQEIGLTLSWEQLRNAFNSQFLAEGISLNARQADAGEFFINLSKELEDDISGSEMFSRFQQVIQDAKELIAPRRPITKKGQAPIAQDPSFVQSQYALQQNISLTQQELTELKSIVGKLDKDLAKQKDLVKQRKALFNKAGVRQADFDHIIDSTSSWEFGTKTSTRGQRASVGQVILETQDAAISYYIHSETTKFMEAVTEKFAPLGYVPNERFSLYAVNQLGKQLGQEANYAVTKMNIAKTKMEQIQNAVRNAAPDNQVRVFNTEMEKAFLNDDEDDSFDFLFGQLKQLLPSSKQEPQRAANTPAGQALRADIVRDIVDEFRIGRQGASDIKTRKLIGGPTGYVPKGKPGDFTGQQTSLSDVYDQDKTLLDWVGSITDETSRNPNTRIDYLSRSRITDKDVLAAADVPTQMSPGVRPEFETLEDALAAGVSENEFNAMYRTPEATRVASEEELINALRNRLERTSISKLLADNKNLGSKYQTRWDKIVQDFKPTIGKTKRISAKRAAAIQFGPNVKLTVPKYFRNAFNPNATPRDVQTFFVNVFGGVENIPGGDFSVTKIRGGKIVKAPAGQVYKKELSESSSYVNARIAAAQKRSTQFSLMQDSLSDPKSVLENPLNIALGPTGHAMMLREMASSIKKQIELSAQTREVQKGLLAKKQKRMGLYYSRKYGEELWSTLIKNSYNPNTKLLDIIQDIKSGKISVTLKKQVEQLEETLVGLGDKEVTGALAKQKQLITELKSFETAQRKLTTLKTQIDNLTMEPIEVVAKQEQNFNSWLNEVTRINGNEVLNEFGQPIWSYESGTYMFDKSLEKQINQRFGNSVELYDTEVLDSNAIMQSGALRMRRTGTKPNKSTTRFVQSDLMKRIQQGEIKAVNVDGAEYGTTFSVSFGTDSIDVVLPPSSPLLDINDAARETVSAYGRQELAKVLGDRIYGSNRALGAPGIDFANEIQISVSPNKDYISSLEKGMREGNVSFVKIKKRINYGEYLSPTNMHAVVSDGPFSSTVRSFSARDYATTSPLRTAVDANGLPVGDITFTPSEWRALFPTQDARSPLVVRNLRASDNAAAKRLEKRLGQIPAELSQLEQRFKRGSVSPTAHAKQRKKLNLELVQSESLLNDLEQSIRLYDDELRAPQTRLVAMNKLRSFYEGFPNLDKAKDWVNGQIRNGQKLNIANIEPRPDDLLLRREIINSNWNNSDYGKHIRQKEQLEKLLTEEFDRTYPLVAQERDVLSYHDSLVDEAIQLEKRFAAVDVPAMMEKRARFQEQLQESGFDFDAFAAPGDAKRTVYEKIRAQAEELFAGIPAQTQVDDFGKTADFYITNQILDTFGGEAQIDNYVLEKLTDLFGREGAARMMLQTEFDTASTVAFADYADNIASRAQAGVAEQMQKLQPIDFQFKTAIAGTNVEIIDPVTREIFQIRQGEELDALRVIRATKTADLNDMISAMGNLQTQVAFDLSKIIRRLRPGYIEQLTKYRKTLDALSQYADNPEGTIFVPKNLGMLDEPISMRGPATGTPGVREGLSDATYARLFSDVKQPKDVRDALVRRAEMQTESEQIENLFKNINSLEAKYATKLGAKTKIDEQLNTLNSTIKNLEASKNRINNLPKLADNAKQQEIDEASEIIDEAVALIAQIRSEANIGAESTGFIPRELRKVMLDLSKKRANYSKALLDSENLDFAAEGIIADFGTNNLPTKQVLEEFDNGWAQLSSAFPSIYVPESVAEIFNNVHRLQDPAIVIALQRGLGNYNKFFKTYATLSPGFHVRNAYNNVFVHLAGGEGFKWIPEALGVIKKWEIAQSNKTTWEEFIAGLSPQQSRRALIARDAVVASGDGLYDSVNADLAFGNKLINWKLPQLSKRAGHWSDYVSRFTYAYSAAANGGEFLDVTARVQKYFIDYSTKSNLDKVMTQIVPFWMFASRNFPLHLQNIYHNPRVYQGYRAIRQNMSEKDNEQNNDVVPAWLRESGAWKLPMVGNWYMTPDLGFMRIQTEVNRLQDPKRFLADVTPALRLPIELAGDRRFFANKKFSKVPIETQPGTALNVLQPLLQALGYGQTGPDGRQFVSDKASYGFVNALPFLGQAERLSATTSPNTGDASPNSLLGYLGLPMRQNTPQMQLGELNAQRQAMQEALAAYNAVNRPER
jgi:hypothetical protein